MASSSCSVCTKKYDVFLSFRGSDVRRCFLSHLHKSLYLEGIEAFVDYQLERGKEISESLLGKIEESHIAIVIFSPNYADSEWCLEELLKIAECRNTTGQIAIPVFYDVDPSHVQDLTGTYGDAMAQLRTKFDESLVDKWGFSLKYTASLSGHVFSNFKTESELTEEIIKHVLEILNRLYPSDSARDCGLVGIDSRVEKVMSLLGGPEDVCVVGIWGEGGTGKTTLARATFDRIRSQFDGQCFVGNVREKCEKFTTDAIPKEVVSKLFGTIGSNMIRKRLSRKKVILVFDDVSDLDEIKSIMRYRVDVGCGSRIIVTSRDRHLLKILGAKICEVKELDDDEALQLFCLNAFRKKVPEQGYVEVSKEVVKYSRGIPLAVEVLGSNLFQGIQEWKDELEKVKVRSDGKVQQPLRISYEGLCDVEKEIFLDIVRFFKGRRRYEAESMLDVAGSKIGRTRLAEQALMFITFGLIKMHDLIQQMAMDIICEEKAPGKRIWLWHPEDLYFLSSRDMGTEAFRGISLDMSKIRNIYLSRRAFLKLYNLRYLYVYISRPDKGRLCVPQGLEYLPQQLRNLYWSQYPYKSLPSLSLSEEKLVELSMCDTQLEQLWDGVQKLPNLKWLNLCGSTKLIKVPDLSAAPNLLVLNLEGCESLVGIPSLKYLGKLMELNLFNCSRLESLPDDICNLRSLIRLDVSYCQNLRALPHNFANLKSQVSFYAHKSAIDELPHSIRNPFKFPRYLRFLSLCVCCFRCCVKEKREETIHC